MGTGNRDQDTKDIVIIETLVTPFLGFKGHNEILSTAEILASVMCG